jgi:hypothetical protein
MKKSFLILFVLCLVSAMGLSAQNLDGRYINATEVNAEDIEVNQIVLSINGSAYEGDWETAMATGENEVVSTLQNVLVDEQDLTISFVKGGQSYNGTFVSDGNGGYAIMLDGQTLYSKEGW